MITKLKLVLATSIALVGAGAGFAAARNFGHGDRDAMKHRFDANEGGVLDDAERTRFEANKDGTLDDAERATTQRERSAARFKLLDSNGDGMLSADEFAKSNDPRHGMQKRR